MSGECDDQGSLTTDRRIDRMTLYKGSTDVRDFDRSMQDM
jgi:hypothetical protein